MKKLISTGLLILSHSLYADPVGTVLFSAKQVTAENAGATRTLTRGGELKVGDTIVTAADASAKIKYANGTLVSIGPSSNYKIVAYSPNQSDVTLTAQLNQGKIESKTDGKEKREALKTPVVALAITGTSYKVYVPSCTIEHHPGTATALNNKNQLAAADAQNPISATDANKPPLATDAAIQPTAIDASKKTTVPDASKQISPTDVNKQAPKEAVSSCKASQTSHVQLMEGRIVVGNQVLHPGQSIAATPAGIVSAPFPAVGNVPANVQIAAAPAPLPAVPAGTSISTSSSNSTHRDATLAGASSSSSSKSSDTKSANGKSSDTKSSNGKSDTTSSNSASGSSSSSDSDSSDSASGSSGGGGSSGSSGGASSVSFLGTTAVAGQGVTSTTAASIGVNAPIGPATFGLECLGG